MSQGEQLFRPCLLAAAAFSLLGVSAAQAQDGPKFEIYGFAQADYIQDFNRVNPNWDATLRPSKIPTTAGTFGDNGQSIISVRQSRFGVQASQDIAGEPLFVKFEFDLFGVGGDEGQTTFRLRHAYGSWGPILAGQTNSLFMDGDTFPNTIDYWGPNGMVFLRNPQVRFTYKMDSGEFAIAVEKPGNDIDPGNIREIAPELGANITGDEKWPDLTAHFKFGDDWGHVQIAGILRKVGYETIGTPDNRPKNSKMGWGINGSANIKTWNKDVLHLSAVYGEGIASYMNDGGTDLGPKLTVGVSRPIVGAPPTGSLRGDVVPLLGLVAYYDHYWNDSFSSSIGWSMVDVDNTSFQSADAFNKAQYASVNLLWTPDKRILIGGEFLWGEREDFNKNKGDDMRLQFSFKYSFSSNDFF
ncbi:MAG: DcaP family trimeric outer membrane transporter, partial [Phenylobacterium sp.]